MSEDALRGTRVRMTHENNQAKEIHSRKLNHKNVYWWKPRCLSDKESACQCRRQKLNPWVWKIPRRRKWQPTPVFQTGKSHGQRNLTRDSPKGHKSVRSDWTCVHVKIFYSLETDAGWLNFNYFNLDGKWCCISQCCPKPRNGHGSIIKCFDL